MRPVRNNHTLETRTKVKKSHRQHRSTRGMTQRSSTVSLAVIIIAVRVVMWSLVTSALVTMPVLMAPIANAACNVRHRLRPSIEQLQHTKPPPHTSKFRHNTQKISTACPNKPIKTREKKQTSLWSERSCSASFTHFVHGQSRHGAGSSVSRFAGGRLVGWEPDWWVLGLKTSWKTVLMIPQESGDLRRNGRGSERWRNDRPRTSRQAVSENFNSSLPECAWGGRQRWMDGWMRMWKDDKVDGDDWRMWMKRGSFSETVVWVSLHNYTYTKYGIKGHLLFGITQCYTILPLM